MFIVIDNAAMRGFVQTETLAAAILHGTHQLKGDFLVVNPNQRRDLSVYNIAQLGQIIKNTTGKATPILTGYADAIARAWEALVDHTEVDGSTEAQLLKKYGPAPTQPQKPTFDGGRAPYNPEKDPDAIAARAQRVTTAAVRAANAPASRTPRQGASGATPTRPRAGTTTARVWDIADATRKENEAITKELRGRIIDACTAEGIDPSTAATQYSKWKRAMEATA